jgi:hypothetical protein
MSEAFFLQRATLPSMKSKNSPNGMKASAAQRLLWSLGSPRQYRREEKTDMIPQNPRIACQMCHVHRELLVPTVELGNKVREMEGPDHGKVTRVLREKLGLLFHGYEMSGTVIPTGHGVHTSYIFAR